MVRTRCFHSMAQVQSLVGELRSCKPRGGAKKIVPSQTQSALWTSSTGSLQSIQRSASTVPAFQSPRRDGGSAVPNQSHFCMWAQNVGQALLQCPAPPSSLRHCPGAAFPPWPRLSGSDQQALSKKHPVLAACQPHAGSREFVRWLKEVQCLCFWEA